MQFKVPQDVQQADRIVWFLTLRQLIICIIGFAFAYAVYTILNKQQLPFVFWFPPVFIIGAITAAFAFLKIANMPFHVFLAVQIERFLTPSKRVWIKGADRVIDEGTYISPEEMRQKAKKEREQTALAEKEAQLENIGEITDVIDKSPADARQAVRSGEAREAGFEAKDSETEIRGIGLSVEESAVPSPADARQAVWADARIASQSGSIAEGEAEAEGSEEEISKKLSSNESNSLLLSGEVTPPVFKKKRKRKRKKGTMPPPPAATPSKPMPAPVPVAMPQPSSPPTPSEPALTQITVPADARQADTSIQPAKTEGEIDLNSLKKGATITFS